MGFKQLTDADVLDEFSDRFSVIEQGSVSGEESAGSVRQWEMIQMVQLAIVL